MNFILKGYKLVIFLYPIEVNLRMLVASVPGEGDSCIITGEDFSHFLLYRHFEIYDMLARAQHCTARLIARRVRYPIARKYGTTREKQTRHDDEGNCKIRQR